MAIACVFFWKGLVAIILRAGSGIATCSRCVQRAGMELSFFVVHPFNVRKFYSK